MWMIPALLGMTGLDQWLKRRVETHPALLGKKLLKNSLVIRKHENQGFMLNKYEKQPGRVKALTTAVTGMVGISWMVLLFRKGQFFLKLGMTMIFSGALGNLIDRYRKGAVTDYVSVCRGNCPKLKKLVFNLADALVFLGAVISMVSECMSAGKH